MTLSTRDPQRSFFDVSFLAEITGTASNFRRTAERFLESTDAQIVLARAREGVTLDRWWPGAESGRNG